MQCRVERLRHRASEVISTHLSVFARRQWRGCGQQSTAILPASRRRSTQSWCKSGRCARALPRSGGAPSAAVTVILRPLRDTSPATTLPLGSVRSFRARQVRADGAGPGRCRGDGAEAFRGWSTALLGPARHRCSSPSLEDLATRGIVAESEQWEDDANTTRRPRPYCTALHSAQ